MLRDAHGVKMSVGQHGGIIYNMSNIGNFEYISPFDCFVGWARIACFSDAYTFVVVMLHLHGYVIGCITWFDEGLQADIGAHRFVITNRSDVSVQVTMTCNAMPNHEDHKYH